MPGVAVGGQKMRRGPAVRDDARHQPVGRPFSSTVTFGAHGARQVAAISRPMKPPPITARRRVRGQNLAQGDLHGRACAGSNPRLRGRSLRWAGPVARTGGSTRWPVAQAGARPSSLTVLWCRSISATPRDPVTSSFDAVGLEEACIAEAQPVGHALLQIGLGKRGPLIGAGQAHRRYGDGGPRTLPGAG